MAALALPHPPTRTRFAPWVVPCPVAAPRQNLSGAWSARTILAPVTERDASADLPDAAPVAAGGGGVVDLEAARRKRVEAERAASDEADRGLVERAQAGDREALGELLHKHGPVLYRAVLLPRLGSDAAAKDALSETYAKVVANIARFTWQNVGFYPWLRTVALRVALDQLRGRKRVALWEEDDLARELDASNTATPIDDRLSAQRDLDDAKKKVDAALEKINPRYASAIRMRVLDERPRDEVAAELGVTPATFDVLLHRAIHALKKTLEVKSDG
jgi:RNA polymerase sigma factor (sigma-70 family)